MQETGNQHATIAEADGLVSTEASRWPFAVSLKIDSALECESSQAVFMLCHRHPQFGVSRRARKVHQHPYSCTFPCQKARTSILVLICLVIFGFLRLSVAAQPTAVDLEGRAVDPIRANPGKIVVLVFLRRDCPVSGRYAPTIQLVSSEHKTDVLFYLVFPDRSDPADQIRRYLHDFSYTIPALRDPSRALVKSAHAVVTPEAAVFDRAGALVYHGRIDDLYHSFGRARPAATTHELEDAIQAAVAGRRPAQKEVAGVGCYISDLE